MFVTGPDSDDVIFSVTLSEGWLDEYKEFDLPVVEDQLTSEEFGEVAVKPELGLNDCLFHVKMSSTQVQLSSHVYKPYVLLPNFQTLIKTYLARLRQQKKF